MLLPDDPPICECRYDETRDEMDRDDCPLHCNLDSAEALVPEVESQLTATEESRPVERKQVAAARKEHEAA